MDIKEEGLIRGDIGKHWYYRAVITHPDHPVHPDRITGTPASAARMAGRLVHRGRYTARSQMQDHGTIVNAMFWAVCRMELPVFQVAGLTAFVRAVKA
jgi:hypothetical protein